MSLAKLIKTLAEEMREAGSMGIAGDLRMVARLIEQGDNGPAKHFIKQYLMDDARPMVHALWKTLYRMIEEETK